MSDEHCLWSEDEDGNWHTSCDEIHILIEGSPFENGMNYCCYCGLTLAQCLQSEAGDSTP